RAAGAEPPEPDEPEPAPPYPEPYLEGLRRFNRRQFWDAHEALEHIWLPLLNPGGPKRFYQALIQVAAAFHHVTYTKRWVGARRLFEEADRKLADYPSRYGGLDVTALRARLPLLLRAVEAIERGESAGFDEALFFHLWPEGVAPLTVR